MDELRSRTAYGPHSDKEFSAYAIKYILSLVCVLYGLFAIMFILDIIKGQESSIIPSILSGSFILSSTAIIIFLFNPGKVRLAIISSVLLMVVLYVCAYLENNSGRFLASLAAIILTSVSIMPISIIVMSLVYTKVHLAISSKADQ